MRLTSEARGGASRAERQEGDRQHPPSSGRSPLPAPAALPQSSERLLPGMARRLENLHTSLCKGPQPDCFPVLDQQLQAPECQPARQGTVGTGQRKPPIPGSIVGRKPRPLRFLLQAEASAAKAPLHLDPTLTMPTRAVSAFPRDGSSLSPRPNQDVTTSSRCCPSRSLCLATPNTLSPILGKCEEERPLPRHTRAAPILCLSSVSGVGTEPAPWPQHPLAPLH